MKNTIITCLLLCFAVMAQAQNVTIGGCTTTTGTSGCTDPCALNYNPDALIDNGSCTFDAEPIIACWETNTYNSSTCQWETTGTQPTEPTNLECYQTTSFSDVSCTWVITGDEPDTDDNCEFTDDSYNTETCEVINVSNCPAGTSLNTINCSCDTDVIEGCTDSCASNYNPDANSDNGTCILPTEPTLECWQTTAFNDATCVWDIVGTQPTEPSTECWETVTFNTTTCVWEVSGTMPEEPLVACYEQAVFNDNTCDWDVIGEQPTTTLNVTSTQVCVIVTESPTISTAPVFTVSPTTPPSSTGTYEVCYDIVDFDVAVEYTFTVTYGECVLTETYTRPCIDCADEDVALDIQDNLSYNTTTNQLCLLDGSGNPLQGTVTNDNNLTVYTLDAAGCVIVPLDINDSVDFYPTPQAGVCEQCVYCVKPLN